MRQHAAHLLSRRPVFPTRRELLHFTFRLFGLSVTHTGSNASICDYTVRRIFRKVRAVVVTVSGQWCRQQTVVEVVVKIPHSHRHFNRWLIKMRTASCTCQSGTIWFSCTPLPLRSCDLGAGIGWLKPWMISSHLCCGIMGNVVYRRARRCVL